MFVQVSAPGVGAGPILIEGVRGSEISRRLSQLARDNAYEAMLIGLMETITPDEHAQQIREQLEAAHLHDHWFAASNDLLAFIQAVGQHAIQELLAQTFPGGLSQAPVDIEEMAKILGVSVPTIRRMIKAEEIPYLKFGRVYRFVPADVIASIQRRQR
jgi:excisionase family DNA binding protein